MLQGQLYLGSAVCDNHTVLVGDHGSEPGAILRQQMHERDFQRDRVVDEDRGLEPDFLAHPDRSITRKIVAQDFRDEPEQDTTMRDAASKSRLGRIRDVAVNRIVIARNIRKVVDQLFIDL